MIQKINGYDLLRPKLQYFEKKDLLPIDIVYEPSLDVDKPIYCYFAPEFHAAFSTCYDKVVRGSKKRLNTNSTRQCPYCNNFFIKSNKKMKEHISCCTGQTGFNFSFDNGKIIDFQDNFKKIGDLPFAVYYDFETTIGSMVFFDSLFFVVSYCIIVAFHPDLNIPRLFIYRSYDQDRSKLTSLIHFETVQPNFFDFKENFNSKTLLQLQNAALAVENRKENTAPAEMFSIELKFTVDCLKFWFERNRKALEITEQQRLEFTENNAKKTWCICDFPIQSRTDKGWFKHVCKAEYLFLENIF